MNKKPIILGIESSCDETAASIITENEQGLPTILSSIVSSQVDVHKEFGGVVPELAARSHMEKIDLITKKAIEDSGIKLEDIDAVATTAGPGLIVCLSVGLSFGKAMASSLNKPFIAVNHLEGHALSPKLNSELSYPYLLLLISGGHTQFLSVQGLGNYKRLGTTIDDAVGEAFDKTAKLLGIEFPGGPQIEVYAKKGDSNKYKLPKPIFHKGGCNLSFAGLKTAVLRISKQIKTTQEKYDLAASFQKTVEEILYKKSKIAFGEFKKINEINKNKFIVAGGVAANKRIREVLTDLCKEEGFESIFPPINLCGDNAAMIAMVGLEKLKLNQLSELDHPAKPRWPLDEDAAFLKGAGVKLE
jgi:N6-L-threonylcarbamoyladenine synthase